MNYRPLVFSLIVLTAPAVARDIGSFDRTLNVNGPVNLAVQNRSGGVTVRAGEASGLRIHAIVRVSDDDYSADTERRAREIQANPPIFQSGNDIRIDRLDDSYDRHISIEYELTTPTQTALHASTGSGGLFVEGIQGPVEATTGSGGIHATNIAGEVSARAGSGGIQLDSIKGRVSAEAGSGGVHADNLAGPVTARTGSGGITLRLPPSAGFDLRAQTGSGPISVDPPLTVQSSSFGRHEVRGQIRGGGPLIELTTGSGGVRIN